MFAYCQNAPVIYCDPSGFALDYSDILNRGFSGYANLGGNATGVSTASPSGGPDGFPISIVGFLDDLFSIGGSTSNSAVDAGNWYSDYSNAVNFLKNNGANPKDVLSSYKGTPKVQTLNSNTIVCRIWGGSTKEYGHWVSPNNYGAAAQDLLSLPQGNTMTNTSYFVLPKGTTVLIGEAAPLFGQSGGGEQWWVPVLK